MSRKIIGYPYARLKELGDRAERLEQLLRGTIIEFIERAGEFDLCLKSSNDAALRLTCSAKAEELLAQAVRLELKASAIP